MANRNFARVMRRKTQWGGFGSEVGAALFPDFVSVASGSVAILSSAIVIGGALGVVDEEVTITRTIGTITVSLNVDTAVVTSRFAVGLGVMRSEALAAGVASMPDPETRPDFEWLYYHVGGLKNPNSALRDGPTSSYTVPFDVRGQRIVRTGETPVWLAAARGQSIHLAIGGRYLLKLT